MLVLVPMRCAFCRSSHAILQYGQQQSVRSPCKSHCVALLQSAGGVGAARDLEALDALGVTHVVNASPIVPCFHRKRLRYRSICVYDDEHDDIAQHFAATSAYIAKVLQELDAICSLAHRNVYLPALRAVLSSVLRTTFPENRKQCNTRQVVTD